MLYRVVHEEAQLQGVPDALAPLVRACLAKDPEERPSTLQLSLRLKEIAAREAQGLADVRPPAPRTPESERPTGRLADTYPERDARRQGGRATPRAVRRPGAVRVPCPGAVARHPHGAAAVSRRPGRGAPRDGAPRQGSPSRPRPRPGPASRGTTRPGTGTGGRRPAPRTTGSGLRPANPRLLRQRLFVFVVVTLVVALGIALVQGCQGPS